MFGMANMRGQIAAAAAVLLLGILALFAVRSNGASGKHRWMLAATAFLGGPIITMMFWVLYVFTAEGYITNKERLEDLWPFLIIGVIVGTATALGVAINNVFRRMTSDKCREQEHTR